MGLEKEREGDRLSTSEFDPSIAKNNRISKRDVMIIQLYEQGLSSYKIAAELEINRHTVTKVLRDNNVEIRSKKQYDKKRKELICSLFKQGKSIFEISNIAGVSRYTVRLTLEEEKLIFNKYERDILNIARYIQMKNKGYETESIAKFLNMTEKQLNKLLKNSGIKTSALRRKAEKIENLPDIVEHKLRGMKAKEIAMKYKLDLVKLKDILEDFGLYPM
ncbi:MAG: hypothetical protein ACTSQE_03800 [Candidatus Heimdallarchaeaceae archaeon]